MLRWIVIQKPILQYWPQGFYDKGLANNGWKGRCKTYLPVHRTTAGQYKLCELNPYYLDKCRHPRKQCLHHRKNVVSYNVTESLLPIVLIFRTPLITITSPLKRIHISIQRKYETEWHTVSTSLSMSYSTLDGDVYSFI